MLEIHALTPQSWTETLLAEVEDAASVAVALQTIAAAGGITLIARMDGRLVGYAAMEPLTPESDASAARLSLLFVLPDVRRRGLGRLLVGALANAAGQQGRFVLRCAATEASAAQAFYLALGAYLVEADNRRWYTLDLAHIDGLRPSCQHCASHTDA